MAGFVYFTVLSNILMRKAHDFESVAGHLSEKCFHKHQYSLSICAPECKPSFLLKKKEGKKVLQNLSKKSPPQNKYP